MRWITRGRSRTGPSPRERADRREATEEHLVRLALREAAKAARRGDPPLGAPHEPHIDPPLPAAEIAGRAHHRIALRGGILAADAAAAQIAAARHAKPAFD